MTNRLARADRIAVDIDALAALTDPDRPWTRRAFTPRFLDGRAHVEKAMVDAGLTVRIDAAGNMIGRRPGRVPGKGVLAVGSHSDTVPDGGRFDGIAGVIAGLEIVRVLNERGIELDHDLEVIDCLAEEVSIFGVSCIGSRAIAGVLPEDWLDRTADGLALSEGIKDVGGDPAHLKDARRSDIAAFLELHIEQGPVLEADHLDVGIVTAIAGITRVEIIVTGRADHAGTTPMTARADALVAAADLVTAVEQLALERSRGDAHFAATVGEFSILPGAANVIPSSARMLIDARAERRADMDAFLTDLTRVVAEVAARRAITIAEPRLVSDNQPTPSDPALVSLLETSAEAAGATHHRMASGAGHDMAFFARIAPAAMLFVPCRGGRSHSPDEWAEPSAIALGTDVLIETIRRLDARQDTE
ncbi:Zn-dependent hydrolase [Pleomorphomonas sp. PLEO]|uniref:Zn-dependent hydrolase n=1 Tax=Pleomorphomonas sp. PLEO TaxID=3239306 RepID=UPI00351F3C98